MAFVKEVAEKIYEITPQDAGAGITCCCYLLVDEQTALIETGSASQVDDILKGMAELGVRAESLACIIPTHIHVDHGGGAGYLARKAHHARVVAHPKGCPHLLDPSNLVAGSRQVFGKDFETFFGPVIPVPEEQVYPVEDDELISLGKRELRILHTPGHCADHISIFDERTQGLFCGEALGGYLPVEDTVVLAGSPPVFMFDKALATIEKIRGLTPEQLFYSQWGHGKDAGRLIDMIREYTMLCGEIIIRGMQAEESEETLTRKLLPYMDFDDRYIPSEPLRKIFKAFGIQPFLEYFKRLGIGL